MTITDFHRSLVWSVLFQRNGSSGIIMGVEELQSGVAMPFYTDYTQIPIEGLQLVNVDPRWQFDLSGESIVASITGCK